MKNLIVCILVCMTFTWSHSQTTKLEFNDIQRKAQAGDPEAQCDLAGMYLDGRQVEKNSKLALQWYEKAAQQGSPRGQNGIGVIYGNGQGVPQNYEEAVKWYKLAADNGFKVGQYNLGSCYRYGNGVKKDLTETVRLYQLSADQDYDFAQWALGNMYFLGEGVAQDYEKAAALLKPAAEKGNQFAQNDIGYCYQMGLGVEKDLDLALKWYEKSARQGNSTAQNNVGILYKNGIGVPQNEREAKKWFKLAAEQGYEPALYEVYDNYTYKGPFKSFQRVYMLDENVTYSYFEREDLSRIYHGDFNLTFTGDGSTATKKISGSIKGQFKCGKYDGNWTFIYPFTIYESVYRNKKHHMVSVPFTATLTCSFIDGKLNGPLKIVATNSAKQIVGEAILNYKNGRRNGEISFYSKIPDTYLTELKGEYFNDKRVGNWTYVHNNNKGVIQYTDSGWEKSNYTVNNATGSSSSGQNINMYDLKFGSISLAELQNVIADIIPNSDVTGLWSD